MQTPPHPPSDAVEKGDHNFYTEKDAGQPPTPPEQIGKRDHIFLCKVGLGK